MTQYDGALAKRAPPPPPCSGTWHTPLALPGQPEVGLACHALAPLVCEVHSPLCLARALSTPLQLLLALPGQPVVGLACPALAPLVCEVHRPLRSAWALRTPPLALHKLTRFEVAPRTPHPARLEDMGGVWTQKPKRAE